MALRFFKTFDLGTITAGGNAEASWVPNTDVHIHRIFFVDRDGLSLQAVDAYIKIGEDVLTHDSAPASLFGQDPLVSVTVDRDVPKGTQVYVKVTNNDTVDHKIVLVFEVTE